MSRGSFGKVLAYHKVDDRFELGLTNVKPRMFHRHIAELKEHGYEISVYPESAVTSNRDVCLTFDDGYDCFYRNVAPILTSINAKAIVFVITDFIGRRNDWDIRLSYRPFVHMNASQLREVAGLGFEVGSHCCSHKDLTRLNRSSARNELVESKKRVEDLLGCEVRAVSFPYGRHNSDVVGLAREAGYKSLFGLGSTVLDGVIERVPVYRFDTAAAVRRKVSGNRLEILKSDFIHSFANVSALISIRNSGKTGKN